LKQNNYDIKKQKSIKEEIKLISILLQLVMQFITFFRNQLLAFTSFFQNLSKA